MLTYNISSKKKVLNLNFRYVCIFVFRIPELNYKLEVVQQPVRARACGFGDKVSKSHDAFITEI